MVSKKLFDRLRGQEHRHGALELLKISEWFSTRHSFMFGQKGAARCGRARALSGALGFLRRLQAVLTCRNLLGRRYRKGPACMARRRSSLSQHNCRRLNHPVKTREKRKNDPKGECEKIAILNFSREQSQCQNGEFCQKRNLTLKIWFNWPITVYIGLFKRAKNSRFKWLAVR